MRTEQQHVDELNRPCARCEHARHRHSPLLPDDLLPTGMLTYPSGACLLLHCPCRRWRRRPWWRRVLRR